MNTTAGALLFFLCLGLAAYFYTVPGDDLAALLFTAATVAITWLAGKEIAQRDKNR